MREARRSFLIGLTTVTAACGSADGVSSGPEVVRETVGDTAVVRTLSGSVWGGEAHLEPEVAIGELDGDPAYLFGRIVSIAVARDGTIYAVDGQASELRAYAPDGTYLTTIGHKGEGPGELKGPDGGLQVLSDGRIVVRDPGNARLQVYAASGEPVDTWPHRGGLSTSSPLPMDTADNVYPFIILDPEADFTDWRQGLVRVSPDGTPGDTLEIPDTPWEAATLEARSGTSGNVSISMTNVPFSPTEEWVFHPDGYFVYGISERYAFTLLRPGGPLRIERRTEPVPVAAGERAEEEAGTTKQMRRVDPDWRWDSSPIPDAKPPFRDLLAARDGRIWVQVWMEGRDVGDPDYDATDPNAVRDAWKESVAFDVFEKDGTFLGRVTTPDDFSTNPTPVFDGDYVWAVTRDELGVQRVVRYRLVTPRPG